MNKIKLKGLNKDVALYLANEPDATNEELKTAYKKGRYIEKVLGNLHKIFGTTPQNQSDTKEARRKLVEECIKWRDNQ